MHHVGTQATEQPEQFPGGQQVGAGVHAAGEVSHRFVTDTASPQRLDVLAGCGGSDHLPSGGGERLQLGSEQQLQADVGRRNVQRHRLVIAGLHRQAGAHSLAPR